MIFYFLLGSCTSRRDGFELDYCYEQHEEIDQVYSREIQPLISEVFDGRNASIIALGARGSGKTHTIQVSSFQCIYSLHTSSCFLLLMKYIYLN